MKAKTRMLWMKLHAYFACFFLPITLLYILTGMLYFFDIKGDITAEVEYFIDVPEGFSENEKVSEKIVHDYLVAERYVEVPSEYYWYEGVHYWYNHEREVVLKRTDKAKVLEIHVKEHDWLEQLLIVHKGFAGNFFKIFSILFGLALTFSVISGVVITLQLPQLKTTSLMSIGAGGALLLVGFI